MHISHVVCRWCLTAMIALMFSACGGGGSTASAPTSPTDLTADYYVSPSGSDSNVGSMAAPFQTLNKALSLVRPGQLIYLRGGTFPLSAGVQVTTSGTSNNYIKVFAYPGEVPIFDASAMTQTGYWSGWPLWLTNASWLHLKGLEIKNGPMGGLVINGVSHYNILENLNVHHNGRLSDWEGKGITLAGSSANNLLLNNDSHHNRDISSGNADGFQVSSTGTGNVLRGNRAWRNSDDGFDFFNLVDNTVDGAVLLENNWSFENGLDDNLQPTGGDGNGFKLGGRRPTTTGTNGAHVLKNNLAWGNYKNGFDENGSNSSLTLLNNSAYNNGDYNFIFYTTVHTLHNNLSLGSPHGISFKNAAGTSVLDHNSWTAGVTVDAADFESLNSSGANGIRKVDGTLPVSGFLRLVVGCDLIDQGLAVGIPYTGRAPDLGAYEFGLAN